MNLIQRQYFNYTTISDIKKEGAELEQGTINNYKAAVNYYLQKEAQFAKYGIEQVKKQVNGDTEKFKAKFSSIMQEQIIKDWDTIRAQILESINIDKDSGAAGKYTITDEKKIRDIVKLSDEQINIIIEGAAKGSNIYSILGFAYEDYLIPALKKNGQKTIEEQAQASIDSIVGNLLSSFETTGKLTSSSLKRSTGFIRPDIGINLSGKKENSVQFGKSQGQKDPLPVELQVNVSIDYKDLKSRWTEANLLKKYLKSQMYGVQVKSWKNKTFNNKSFTQMSSLQSRLNQIFENQYTNLKYAGQIMHYEVSRDIFDIVGIVNIGILTGENFIWVSNLLSNYIFTMNLVKNNGNNDFAQVKIANSNIILRHITNLLKSTSLLGSVSEKKEINLKEEDKVETVIPITYKIASRNTRVGKS